MTSPTRWAKVPVWVVDVSAEEEHAIHNYADNGESYDDEIFNSVLVAPNGMNGVDNSAHVNSNGNQVGTPQRSCCPDG